MYNATEPIFTAILLGGGKGIRFGADTPKIFALLNGESLVLRVLKVFFGTRLFDSITVTCPSGWEDETNRAAAQFGASVVVGGKRRQDSVRIALEDVALRYKDRPFDSVYVLIHDIARCYVTEEIIQRCVAAVEKYNAISTGIPLVDSVKVINEKMEITESLDRSKIWLVQTPQAFRLDIILDAHRKFHDDVTDDAALVESSMPVRMIEGAIENKKVTWPGDL